MLKHLLSTIIVATAVVIAATNGSRAETRVALVIGNGAYQNAPRLPNPANDASDVAAALKRDGFDTILATDLNRDAMEGATIRFARAARNADVALFYYSGHAIQFGGANYLLPVDAKLTDEADLRRLVRLDDMTSDLQRARNLRILVVELSGPHVGLEVRYGRITLRAQGCFLCAAEWEAVTFREESFLKDSIVGLIGNHIYGEGPWAGEHGCEVIADH